MCLAWPLDDLHEGREDACSATIQWHVSFSYTINPSMQRLIYLCACQPCHASVCVVMWWWPLYILRLPIPYVWLPCHMTFLPLFLVPSQHEPSIPTLLMPACLSMSPMPAMSGEPCHSSEGDVRPTTLTASSISSSLLLLLCQYLYIPLILLLFQTGSGFCLAFSPALLCHAFLFPAFLLPPTMPYMHAHVACMPYPAFLMPIYAFWQHFLEETLPSCVSANCIPSFYIGGRKKEGR